MPFSNDQLRARYGTHRGFALAWKSATIAALKAGFLEPEDAVDLSVVGVRSDILK